VLIDYADIREWGVIMTATEDDDGFSSDWSVSPTLICASR
jgi:hypothetical protein